MLCAVLVVRHFRQVPDNVLIFSAAVEFPFLFHFQNVNTRKSYSIFSFNVVEMKKEIGWVLGVGVEHTMFVLWAEVDWARNELHVLCKANTEQFLMRRK